MSIGAIDLIGWTTKVTEYNKAITMKAKISVTTTTTNPQTRVSICSTLRRCGGLGWFNFLLQYRGYKIFRTSLREQTARLLTFSQSKVIRVLTGVAISVFASH
jgi:hypothetical protein